MWGRRAYLSLGGGAAAILMAVAAGCGGSSSAPVTGASGASGASGSTALTKSSFIKQADAICAEANSAIASLSGGAVPTDQSTQASQELEITHSELQSLQALTAPSQDRTKLNDFLAGLRNEVDALTRANTAIAQGGDTSTADSELAGAKSNAQQAAADYGFQDCARSKSRHTQPGVTTATTTPAPTATTTTPVTPTTTTTAVPTTPTTPTTPLPPSGGTPSGGTGGGSSSGGGGTGNGGTGGGGTSP